MKKLLILSALTLMLSLPPLASADNDRGGFTGPSGAVVTVAEAKNLADDTPVTLAGRLEKRLGDDKYQFSDGTGTIIVEIDDDDWKGLTVGPNDLVEIHGEIDKGRNSLEIDVDRIVKK